MTTFHFAVIIICCCACLIVGTGFGVKYAQNHGVNPGTVVNTVTNATEIANNIYDKLSGVLPESPAMTVIGLILDLADRGAKAAEQLYKTATIGKDDRYIEATKFVTDALTTAGVKITPELETVIKGAITGAVESLPKTHDEDGNVIKG